MQEVEVTVHDDDIIERVTGPEGDEWRAHLYDLHTESDVIKHLVYNYAANGVNDISRLDGWADVEYSWDSPGIIFRTLNTDIDIIG